MFIRRLTRPADRRTVHTLVKLLLGAAAIVFVAYLLTLLPGADRLVPATPVSFAAVVSAVATAVLVAVLWIAAPRLAAVTRSALSGPEAVVEHLASVVHWLVVLVAVLVAHGGFAGVAAPILGGSMWLYDLAFLLAAVPPVLIIGVRLYVGIDPAATAITDGLFESEDDGGPGPEREGEEAQ